MRKAVWMWGWAAQEPEVLKSPGGVPTGFTSVPRGSLLPSRSEFVLGKGNAAHTDRLCFFFFFLANVSNILLIKTAARSVHAFNPRTGETESDESLIYRARSWTA